MLSVLGWYAKVIQQQWRQPTRGTTASGMRKWFCFTLHAEDLKSGALSAQRPDRCARRFSRSPGIHSNSTFPFHYLITVGFNVFSSFCSVFTGILNALERILPSAPVGMRLSTAGATCRCSGASSPQPLIAAHIHLAPTLEF